MTNDASWFSSVPFTELWLCAKLYGSRGKRELQANLWISQNGHVAEGRQHSVGTGNVGTGRSTTWKDGRAWGFPGLDVWLLPSVLFSAHFPGQVHLYPLLQLPEASNQTCIFLAQISFLSLWFLNSIFNRMSESLQAQTTHSCTHGLSFLILPLGESGQKRISHPMCQHPVGKQLKLMPAAKMPQLWPPPPSKIQTSFQLSGSHTSVIITSH